MNKNICIGIDLGTTYSCVGVYRNGRVEIIPNDLGERTTPSYVSFTEDDIIVGTVAKNQISKNLKNTVFDIKRLIGRNFSDTIVQNDMKHWAFKVEDDNDKPIIKVNYKDQEHKFTPEEISAIILKKLKTDAENYLGFPIKRAVITVPAYFNDSQRKATQYAGKLAGLDVIRIINEPTSSAIAYGLDKKNESRILVFDLGGGTFDVSLLVINNGIFEVKATAGDTHLGGEDFDNRLVTYCLKEFKRKYPQIDIQKLITNKKVLRRLRTECEQAKRNLSKSLSTNINCDNLFDGYDLSVAISRARFENLCNDDFMKTLEPIKQVLNDANYKSNDIDDIVLIGGSTRIPRISEIIKEFFNKEPKKDINPDEAVAVGASIQGAILCQSLNNNDNLDPTLDNLVLIDVTPLSLGLETLGGIMTKIIDRNTPIPCRKERVFSTYSDNQPSVKIKIFEGEREFTKHNNLLGNFELTGIPPMPRGVPKITVVFEVDHNGILKVSATEESKGKSKKITVKSDTDRLNENELVQILEDAHNYKMIDREKRDKIIARTEFENYLYNLRNFISQEEFKNKIGDKNYKIINRFIIDAIQWLDCFENQNLEPAIYKEKQKILDSRMTELINL